MQFRLSEYFRVPESPGCYAITNIYDDILYVGQSINLSQRMSQHLSNPRMTEPTNLGLGTWFYYELWPSSEINAIETRLLFNHKAVEGLLPPLNRIGP